MSNGNAFHSFGTAQVKERSPSSFKFKTRITKSKVITRIPYIIFRWEPKRNERR